MTQLAINLNAPPSYAADDFVLSDSNCAAHTLLMRWPDWPQPWLNLHGPEASGKTHLAHIWQLHAQAAMIDASALQGDPAALFAGASTLVLEIHTESPDEEALFHLINYTKNERKSLLLTSRTACSLWQTALPDLSSRLKAMPSVALEQPDDMLISGLLIKLMSDRQMTLAPEITHYIIKQIDRTCHSVKDLVQRIDEVSLEQKRNVTLPLVRDILAHRERLPHGRGYQEESEA